MKKLISILTAAVLTFCTAAALPSNLCTSADDAAQKAFEKISCTLEDGTVRFSPEPMQESFLLFTDDDFELTKSDNDYLFTPAENGEYVIVFMEYVDVPNVTFGFYLNFYAFCITSENGNIDLGEDSRYFLCSDDESLVSETPDTGPLRMDFAGILFYIAGSYLNDTDHFFLYGIGSSINDPVCYALMIPLSENTTGVWQENEGVISPLSQLDRFDFHDRNLPAIPGTVLPHSGAVTGMWLDKESEDMHLTTVKCEGSRTIKYSIELVDEYYLDSSTFTVTECPENDINADGAFNVADAVLLSKWLLGDTKPLMVNWHSADLSGDGILDAFDLCFMREKLIADKPAE